MIGKLSHIREIAREERGAVLIETAFIVPILAVLTLGGFEASMIVSRHLELQSAAAEASAIMLARVPDEQSERDTLKQVIERSTGLAADKITLSVRYRCNTDTSTVTAASSCPADAVISEYIELRIQDTYTPVWTGFGFGDPIDYDLTRRVQIA